MTLEFDTIVAFLCAWANVSLTEGLKTLDRKYNQPMCFQSDVYHAACKHWHVHVYEKCIRTDHTGWSSGCEDRVTTGSERAEEMCRQCRNMEGSPTRGVVEPVRKPMVNAASRFVLKHASLPKHLTSGSWWIAMNSNDQRPSDHQQAATAPTSLARRMNRLITTLKQSKRDQRAIDP